MSASSQSSVLIHRCSDGQNAKPVCVHVFVCVWDGERLRWALLAADLKEGRGVSFSKTDWALLLGCCIWCVRVRMCFYSVWCACVHIRNEEWLFTRWCLQRFLVPLLRFCTFHCGVHSVWCCAVMHCPTICLAAQSLACLCYAGLRCTMIVSCVLRAILCSHVVLSNAKLDKLIVYPKMSELTPMSLQTSFLTCNMSCLFSL